MFISLFFEFSESISVKRMAEGDRLKINDEK